MSESKEKDTNKVEITAEETEQKVKNFLFALLTENQKKELLHDVKQKTSLPGSRYNLISRGHIVLIKGSGESVI